MKQEEIRKCTKVVELFRSMMDELGDMCVVYDVRWKSSGKKRCFD